MLKWNFFFLMLGNNEKVLWSQQEMCKSDQLFIRFILRNFSIRFPTAALVRVFTGKCQKGWKISYHAKLPLLDILSEIRNGKIKLQCKGKVTATNQTGIQFRSPHRPLGFSSFLCLIRFHLMATH